MAARQKEVLSAIRDRWNTKGKGTYIDRKISRSVYALAEAGLVKIYPYTIEFGNEAFPTEASIIVA